MAKESASSAERTVVADRLHSTAIHLLRRLRKVDEASGLTAARLSALSVLVFGGPITVGDLARMEQVTAPTMSRLVRGLERDGLVVREAHDGDGRFVRVRATPKGRKILERGRERRVLELTSLLDALPSKDCAVLGSAAEILERVLARPLSASDAYSESTAERRWSD